MAKTHPMIKNISFASAPKPKLEWWTGSNGNLFADHKGTRYCVATQWAGGFKVAANGSPIGEAQLLPVAKGLAEDHAAA